MRSALRYALRVFRAHPGITFVAILSLASGMGANSTTFSVVDGMYLRAAAGARSVLRACVVEGNADLPGRSPARESACARTQFPAHGAAFGLAAL